MKQFIIKSLILTAILFVVLSILEDRFNEKALEDNCRRSNWVFSFKNQHFDFAFCGDSRAYNMVHIPTIQNKTELEGINLGYTGTVFEEQYLLMKKFIENGNSIDKLYIQADLLSFDSASRSRHQFRVYNYIPYLGNDTTITNVVEDNTNLLKILIWKHVPLARYIEYNLEYPITFLLKDFSSCKSDFDVHGSELKSGRSPAFSDRISEYVPIETKKQPATKKTQPSGSLVYEELVSEHTMSYFNRLTSLCKDNGIEVTLYTPPLFNANNDDSGYREELELFLGNIAKDVGIEYRSFLTDSMCSEEQYFFDASHTNDVGTKVFSELLAKEFQ